MPSTRARSSRVAVCDAPETWDALVKAHPLCHVLQSWNWGEVKAASGWRPLRLVAEAGSSVAAAQVLFRPLLGMSVAYVPRGPAWSGDARLDEDLLRAIGDHSRRGRAAFLRLEPNVIVPGLDAPAIGPDLRGARFREASPLQPGASVVLDLRPELDAIFAGFSKGHRADVRRAEREGVQVRIGGSEADLDAFYALMRDTQRRKAFGIHERPYYLSVWRTFGPDAALLLAEHDGAVVAGALIVGYGPEAYYLYSGSTERGLRVRASHLLQWHAIQWARERGHARYDLWGIPEARARQEAEPTQDGAGLDGLYRFKKGWGGEVVLMQRAYDRVSLPPMYWLWLWRRSA